uniref:Uncharacterized protein n=1 Tax=Arundo donax TaxID=35708 RepID=A0A0A9GJI8_ARUDO
MRRSRSFSAFSTRSRATLRAASSRRAASSFASFTFASAAFRRSSSHLSRRERAFSPCKRC